MVAFIPKYEILDKSLPETKTTRMYTIMELNFLIRLSRSCRRGTSGETVPMKEV